MPMVKQRSIPFEILSEASLGKSTLLPGADRTKQTQKAVVDLIFQKQCPWARLSDRSSCDFISGTTSVSVIPVPLLKRPVEGSSVDFEIDRFASPKVFVLIGIRPDFSVSWDLGYINATALRKSSIMRSAGSALRIGGVAKDDFFDICIDDLARNEMDESIFGNCCTFMLKDGKQCKRMYKVEAVVDGVNRRMCSQHFKVMDWMSATGRLQFVD